MRILLIGPVGSGKSTQAQVLADKLGLPLIMAGGLLRNLAARDSEVGAAVDQAIHHGKLVPDEIVVNTVKNAIDEVEVNGFVADGYPRTIEQLQLFDPHFDQVFFLSLSDTEVKKRLLQRHREDDKPEIIETRLKEYYVHTLEIVKYYKDQGILVEVPANQTIDQIADQIGQNLKK